MSDQPVQSWPTGPGNTAFYECRYAPKGGVLAAKAVVIFLHAFMSHISTYSHIFTALAQQSIAVVAFDQRGFGRTALDSANRSRDSAYGKSSTQEQWDDIEFFIKRSIKWAGSDPETKVFLLGHSMGGIEALSFVTQSGSPYVSLVSGVLAISPLVNLPRPPSTLLRVLGKMVPDMKTDYNTDPYVLSHDRNVGDRYLIDPLIRRTTSMRVIRTTLDTAREMNAFGWTNWPAHLPLYVAHGTEDQVSSYTASQSLFERIQATDRLFSSFEGGWHELHNEPGPTKTRIVEEIVDWVVTRSDL